MKGKESLYLLVVSGVILLNVVVDQALGAYTGQCSTSQDIADLPPGHWCEVPNSHLRDAEKKPQEWPDWDGNSSASYDSYQRQTGIKALIQNWNGGVYDSKRDRLIVWGGGHNGYGGNELFGFGLNTLRWERITDPTAFPNRHSSFQNNDGTPISRHTYGGLEYIAHADRFFAFGGAPDSASGGCGTKGTWTFDFTGGQWQLMTNPDTDPSTRCEDKAVYDPLTRKIFYHARVWHAYDYDSNAWTDVNSVGRPSALSVAIDPGRRRLIELGAGYDFTRSYDLDSQTLKFVDLATSGPKTIETASNPGLAYDPVSDRIVGWNGGVDVYSLDLDTNAWTRHTPAPTNLVNPGNVDATGGVYGRFRYSPSKNVFVMVDHVDENVYIYRFADGVRPTPPTNLQVQ
jgi:hypothetical protein